MSERLEWQDRKLWFKLLGVYIGIEILIKGYKLSGFNQRINDQLGNIIL